MQTDEEKLRVINLLMWLQVAIYACDEVENIRWFNKHRTKQSLQSLVRTILTEHNVVIKAFWDTKGVQMEEITMILDELTKQLAHCQYHKLPEVTEWIVNNDYLREI
jgi:hypothetical protein